MNNTLALGWLLFTFASSSTSSPGGGCLVLLLPLWRLLGAGLAELTRGFRGRGGRPTFGPLSGRSAAGDNADLMFI